MNQAAPLYLDAVTLRACLGNDEIREVVRATLERLDGGRVVNGPKAGFSVAMNGGKNHMGTVSGSVPDEGAAGAKWFVVSDANAGRGLPRVPATVVLVDAATGLLTGVVDATQLTSTRTAAMALAAALRAARTVPRKAAVIGAGAIGCDIVRALAAHSPVRDVAVCVPGRDSAAAACAGLRGELSPDTRLRATPDTRDAVAGADLVFTATSAAADASFVHADWLEAGAVVCTVGSHREVDPSVIDAAAEIVVDDVQGVQTRGNLATSFRSGHLTLDRISSDVAGLMSGRWQPGGGKAGPILIALVGLGVLDVALATRALANARRLGRGQRLGGAGDA